jgi:hypothetical protein
LIVEMVSQIQQMRGLLECVWRQPGAGPVLVRVTAQPLESVLPQPGRAEDFVGQAEHVRLVARMCKLAQACGTPRHRDAP